jgi:hypothetical protein
MWYFLVWASQIRRSHTCMEPDRILAQQLPDSGLNFGKYAAMLGGGQQHPTGGIKDLDELGSSTSQSSPGPPHRRKAA